MSADEVRSRAAEAPATKAVDRPTEQAILERARSLTDEAVWMVWLQRRRWQRDEPEDEEFLFRRLADMQFLIVSLRRARRAAEIAAHVPSAEGSVRDAIARFDAALPGLATMRNVGEHIDDYAIDSPDRHHKVVGRRMLQNASWDETTFRWLGQTLNVDEALAAVQQLFIAVRDAHEARRDQSLGS